MTLKYGVWYASTDPNCAWTKIQISRVDEFPPTTYGQRSRSGRTRKPEDAGFVARMVDRRTGSIGVYAPPMVEPSMWRPGEVPRPIGEDYLKWIEKRIESGSLVEAS